MFGNRFVSLSRSSTLSKIPAYDYIRKLTIASIALEKIRLRDSEMTCYVSSETLNSAYLLDKSQIWT